MSLSFRDRHRPHRALPGAPLVRAHPRARDRARRIGVPKPVDFAGAWAGIVAVPGLIALIVFSTFNNLLGGVFMALMDPCNGLTLVPVEVWGFIWAAASA